MSSGVSCIRKDGGTCTKFLRRIDDTERVCLRLLEAAEKIIFRLLLFGAAAIEVYRYLHG
jgi:hypothetical protein